MNAVEKIKSTKNTTTTFDCSQKRTICIEFKLNIGYGNVFSFQGKMLGNKTRRSTKQCLNTMITSIYVYIYIIQYTYLMEERAKFKITATSGENSYKSNSMSTRQSFTLTLREFHTSANFMNNGAHKDNNRYAIRHSGHNKNSSPKNSVKQH